MNIGAETANTACKQFLFSSVFPLQLQTQPDLLNSYRSTHSVLYRDADKSLARPTPRCILFDGENISFDASLVLYIQIVQIFLQL